MTHRHARADALKGHYYPLADARSKLQLLKLKNQTQIRFEIKLKKNLAIFIIKYNTIQ